MIRIIAIISALLYALIIYVSCAISEASLNIKGFSWVVRENAIIAFSIGECLILAGV